MQTKMKTVTQHFDAGTIIIIAITLVLFGVALFEKGFSHDLLLETGVFLVSVKLILMSYKNNRATYDMQKQLDSIQRTLEHIANTKNE